MGAKTQATYYLLLLNMLKNIEKIIALSKKRINYLHNVDNRWFYKWNKTYINAIIEELEEVKKEIKENNSIYLEDELWDVFWAYICLLNSMEEEWLINKKKVFERSYNKFSERIWPDWNWWRNWEEIKNKQKEERKKEHEKKYWENHIT